MANAIFQFSSLCRKEARCFMRSSGQVMGMIVFVLMISVVASLSLRQVGVKPGDIQKLASGIFWILNAFVAVLALQYTALIEEEDNAHIGVLYSGAPLEVLFLSKWLCSSLLLFALQMFTLFCCILLLNLTIGSGLWAIVEISVLCSCGLSAVGVLLSSIAVTLRSREILLPVLLFPVCLPILAGAVFLTQEVMLGYSLDRVGFWYLLLCCFSGIVVSLGVLLYEHILR